ncbi:X-Pro dipeptidyl-peptidase protein [Colletotrichum melonis]|uniref:X-Pro dipeptidyl-peptidase protein n=1 Tax=Colletotrichum melonis TaxID=1209925 RepID=A0AAI9XXZ1_9PEZI|nr:X-Pro dipeptidyl-peptidase protein [Colletotrichum melonis]
MKPGDGRLLIASDSHPSNRLSLPSSPSSLRTFKSRAKYLTPNYKKTSSATTSTSAKVTFTSRSYKLAGQFYPPVIDSPAFSGAAVVIAHPWTSVKEHSPTHYARVLSQAGFYCLAYDAANQGESEGEPRYLEDPGQRVEDIKSAVTYLVSRDEIDSEKIGVLGICASGGYVSFAARTDLRNSDVTGEKVDIIHMLPDEFDPATAPTEMPESFRDLASPFLAITGIKAASKWYSGDAVAKAKEPKEPLVVDGLTHADLYDDVEVAGPKLNEFIGKYLVQGR